MKYAFGYGREVERCKKGRGEKKRIFQICGDLELIYGLGVFSGGILKYKRIQGKDCEDRISIMFVIIVL